MKILFKRLRSWYTANRKYDGFFTFVWFSLCTVVFLIRNIVIGADRQDWIICTLWLLTVIYNFIFWQNDKCNQEVTKFLIDRSAEMVENLANELAETRGYLIAANRRRKRAERQLKHAKKMYRFALEKNIELVQCTICGVRPSPSNEIKENQPQ